MKTEESTTVLVLGANGMLGNAVLRYFLESADYLVFGTVRSRAALLYLPQNIIHKIIPDVDIENHDTLSRLFSEMQPDVVINCVGLVKQLAAANDPLTAIPINALLPHRLARLCKENNSRLVHLSTDCVFTGAKGMYTESDVADATDLYGRSKYLGEVDYPHAITLRTSIIGHGLLGAHSLVGWFLAQQGCVKGYRRAVFSGLPTVEIARIISEYVIPNIQLHGVYHVSATPINKFDLLKLVAQTYSKEIEIVADDCLVIDRSLDSTRFQLATGYVAPEWVELIRLMHYFK